MNYTEALDYIHHVSWRGSRLGLTRTQELLARVGNPEQALRFVHVAGTNGKGSTCAMLASILSHAGYRTGLYTSPYINRFNERMVIDGAPIPDAELAKITTYVRPFADAMADPPTEFELITVIALLYFLNNQCDIVVLEVGMGGEFDSTNVIPVPTLAVITNIGLDHTRELGPTMADIACAKAGIIKPHGDVVCYGRNPAADAVFAEVCQRRQARLTMVDHDAVKNVRYALTGLTFDYGTETDLRCPLIGSYQTHNIATALTAVELLNRKGFCIDSAAVRAGLSTVLWPARFEILGHNPLFIADGGHNPQGVEAALDSVQKLLPDQKPVFLMGIMADKDIPRMLGQIGACAKAFVTVTPDNPRALPAKALAERLTATGYQATAADSIAQGVELARELAGPDGAVLALGSLYMLGDIRACMHVK